MSAIVTVKPFLSYADFVVFEEQSDTKHEWLDDVAYDLAEGTPAHAIHKQTAELIFGSQAGGMRCRFVHADRANQTLTRGLSLYPEVIVICGAPGTNPDNDITATIPRVLVELLSRRGEKFAHYRRIPSLAEYVLVSQNEPCIEVFRQTSPGNWELAEKGLAGQTVILKSIECVLSVDDVYRDPLAA